MRVIARRLALVSQRRIRIRNGTLAAAEACLLYEEAALSVRLADLAPAWMPLLGADELDDRFLHASPEG